MNLDMKVYKWIQVPSVREVPIYLAIRPNWNKFPLEGLLKAFFLTLEKKLGAFLFLWKLCNRVVELAL